MSAFIYAVNGERVGVHLGLTVNEGVGVTRLHSKMGLQLSAPAIKAFLLSGKDKGSEVEEVGANQRATVTLGHVYPQKYQVQVVVNPVLYQIATVQAPTIVEPSERVALTLVIHAHSALELASIPWLVRLYSYT